MERADWELVPRSESVALARQLVATALGGRLDYPVHDIVLVVSELVTNAVLHGKGPVGLTLSWDEYGARIEVRDQSRDLPGVQAARTDSPGGRGLIFVETLSDGWGVEATTAGKMVWVHVPMS